MSGYAKDRFGYKKVGVSLENWHQTNSRKILFLILETFTIFMTFNRPTLHEIFWNEISGRSRWVHFRTWPKDHQKIFYNIDLAEQTNDPKLFKKLQNDIWEFRTKYAGLQIRLLAFWDKTDNKETLILATHGSIKKVDKVPANEIDRAVRLMDK